MRALIMLSEFIPYGIITIRRKLNKKVSNSTFWNAGNGLDYKNKWYKFLLFIIIIEVDVDYLLEVFFEVKGKINFPWSLCGPSFVKNKELDWKKWPFSSTFQVPKKIQDNSRNSKNLKNSRTGDDHETWNQIL